MADDDGYEQSDDNINYRSISCERIPELFMDKLVAKKHFSKFGKINRFILRPNRLCCTVDYETEEDAANAYENAGNFNGHEFIINYAEKEVAHIQNTEEWVDPEVQAELDAMGYVQRQGPVPNMPQAMMKPPAPQRAVKPASQKTSRSAPSAQAAEQAPVLKVDASVRAELEAVLRKPAYTDEEKYRVLDARDKLIRLTTVRQTDIKKAVSTKGTCPDMCPEKERLMREFQRQVSSFEMSTSGSTSSIDHRRAIKEYSRSSADQEVPLSHELRSEKVLQMTMLYLMHNILDLCDDPQTSIADWFHFVWDRTRSVRKDITQQELCSLGAVQLVEQCARFHIHCAARLVAEDPSVFDKKINAENLTKCLQTLKYMYHDLRIKNIRCPCEAEFRSYIVLLNLGDANFLWELKQLPEEIQNSQEIKRAIAFYNALQNNNYVRFFNMIRAPETSYLSACILLGYFTKLRLKAMEAIVKSHNWRKNAVSLPLTYLMNVLGFEDVEAAMGFFSAHGLHCDEERVMLDRLKLPDIEYAMDRALNLVESKRNVSVGECVCGHPLESAAILQNHQPHNSFDSNGLLRADAWTADDQLRGEAASAKRIKQPPPQQQQQQQQQTQPQQSRSQSIQHPSQPVVAPPSIRTSDNIFKVPMASPPISPKQQQQKQQQQQLQNSNKPTTSSSSIFGGNFFAGDAAKTPSPQTSSAFGSNSSTFGPLKTPTNGMGAFGSPAESTSSTDSSRSIFKIPIGGSTSAKPKSTEPSSANAFFNSIFKPNTEKTASGPGIFGGFATTSSSGTKAPDSGGNIFGSAAKETANIFQQQPQPAVEPKPMQSDNIFKHFQTTAPGFGAAAPSAGKSIFGAQASPSMQQQLQAEIEAKKAEAEAAERKRQLEEEHRLKLAQLEEERRKLKELEEKRQQEAARKQTLEKFNRNVEEEYKKQLESLLMEQIREVATEELETYEALERRTLQLTADLIDECVQEQVTAIQNEEYALMCHDQMILHRYFGRWLHTTRKKIEQRKLMESTPIWVTTETRDQQTQQLMHPRQAENLKMIKRYRLGEPCNFKQLLCIVGDYGAQRLVDLFQVVAKHATRKQLVKGGLMAGRKYFKLLLSLPGDTEELPGFEGMCNRWLQKYVRQSPRRSDQEVAFINNMAHDVALCVRKLTGVIPANEAGQRASHESDNADAVVFLMTGDNLRNTRRRLHHLLKLSQIHKPLAIAFVVYNANVDERELGSYLGLEDFVDEAVVSNFRIYGCQEAKSEFNFYRYFSHAAQFVARESSFNNGESEALEMQSLQSWLEAALGEEMWQRWHESCLQNPVFSKVCTIPRFAVELYNEALQRLREIVAEDLQEAPEFPDELREFVPEFKFDITAGLEHFPKDWKSPIRCQQLLKFLDDLRLPDLVEEPPTSDVDDVELFLLNYACRCIPDDDQSSTQAGYQAIKALIDSLNNETMHDSELSRRLSMISWLPITKPLAFAHINRVLQSSTWLPREIIYRHQSFVDYQQQPWWLNLEPLKAVTVDYSRAEATDNVEAEPADITIEDMETIIHKAEKASRRAERNLLSLKQQSVKNVPDDLTRELDESLYQFELAKKCGSFDVSFVAAALQDDDDLDGIDLEDYDEQAGAVGGYTTMSNNTSPSGRKRKRDEGPVSEMDAIMAKAFALIEKVETQEDRLRLHTQKFS